MHKLIVGRIPSLVTGRYYETFSYISFALVLSLNTMLVKSGTTVALLSTATCVSCCDVTAAEGQSRFTVPGRDGLVHRRGASRQPLRGIDGTSLPQRRLQAATPGGRTGFTGMTLRCKC